MFPRWAIPVLIGFAATLAAEVKVPPIWPQITGTFPRGGQRGTEVAVTIRGRNLQDSKGIVFRSAKLNGRVVSSDPYEVKAVISVDAGAEPGRHDLRLIAAHGSAITYFDVSTFSERLEKEPNDDRKRAEAISFPLLMNGIVRQGDYDYFRFEAKAGETLTFDVLATRNGANTDAAIGLLNERGEEIDFSDDYYGFKDPHLVHRFEQTGVYFLRVHGSGEAGSDTSDYRLIAGAMPHADLAMPGGGKRGSTVELSLKGVNLDQVREVILGDDLAKGEVLSARFDETRVRIRIPENAAAGTYRLHAGSATLPVPFVVSNYEEVTVADGRARSRKDPVPVPVPVVINGIIDSARAADYVSFRVDAAKTIVLEAQAMQLGFLTDPLVAIYDESGKRLAYQDEPTTNTGKEPANMDPHLVFTLPKAGRYTAMVRDAQFRGDPAFLYRLTIKEAEPDFSLRIIGTDETLYRGRTNTVLVRVRRLEGWSAPVEVFAENLPPGVHLKPVIADPKNTPYTGTCGETHYLDGTNIEMHFEVDADAPLNLAQIRLRGRGVYNGRTVERAAKARYFRSRIRHIGDAEEDDLRATVAVAPGVVLGVPQNLSLNKDGTASFTAIVTRLENSDSRPLEITLEAAADGLEMPPLQVDATSTRAEIKLKAGGKAPGEFLLAGRIDGRVVGKSHPVRLRSAK
jgi:hypothetical protein